MMAMAIPLQRHLEEEAAEKYSMGKVSARKRAEIDTHLLICESCRQKVSAADEYVVAMRNAAAKLRKEAPKPKARLRDLGK